jgi:hypothetical protein
MKLTRRRIITMGVATAVLAISITSLAPGVSVRKLVKKEVAKQIDKATGPTGPAGAPGAAGAAGAAGSARAYATVQPRGSAGCNGVMAPPQPCNFHHAKGITSVTYTAVGVYCVVAAGVNPTQVAAVVSVDFAETDDPEGLSTVQTDRECAGDTGFEVKTERITGATTAAANDNTAFNILIP